LVGIAGQCTQLVTSGSRVGSAAPIGLGPAQNNT
jgi:hypothetical protein